MSNKQKKVLTISNYTEHFLVSAIVGCTSISAFASLLVIPIRITSSAIMLKEYDDTKGKIKQ